MVARGKKPYSYSILSTSSQGVSIPSPGMVQIVRTRGVYRIMPVYGRSTAIIARLLSSDNVLPLSNIFISCSITSAVYFSRRAKAQQWMLSSCCLPRIIEDCVGSCDRQPSWSYTLTNFLFRMHNGHDRRSHRAQLDLF